MVSMSVYECKNRLSELLRLIEIGMEIEITRNKVPVARLVPIREQQSLQEQL